MTCQPMLTPSGALVGHFCTTSVHEVTHEGRTWRFEFDPCSSPWPVRRDGTPYKRAPGERSPFWPAFESWLREQG
jgi:hypothetical protein